MKPPNPRLQRTRLRVPLSRKPLGAAVKNLGRARGESPRSGSSASLAAAGPSPAFSARPRRLLAP